MDMQTDSTQAGTGFGGQFNSHAGSQFMGNSFNTDGAPIYFDSSSDSTLPTSIRELPDHILSSHFTGRGDELQQIDRAFRAPSGGLPARCVVYGMPGVGKTQLALQYAAVAFGRSQYAYTFWVSAGSVEKLVSDVSKIVQLLRLPGRSASDQVMKLIMARAWLEDPTAGKKWLLVLDNVTRETITMILGDILPRSNSGGRILLTTRTAIVAESCTIPGKSLVVALQPPGTDDAITMLAAGAGIGGQSTEEAGYADLECLVRSVGNLPLAIDQAASYMKGYESNTKELLDIYRSEEVVEFLSWENDLSRHEEKSVVATFMPALNRILQSAPDALTLLRIFSFCDPERIPINILKEGCSALYDTPIASAINKLEAVIDLFRSPIRLSEAIQKIQRLSLAVYTLEGSERIIRIHDLVQLLLRSKLLAAVEREQWLEMVICIIHKAFEAIGDRRSTGNWGRYSQLIRHIEFMEGFAKQYRLDSATLLDASSWAAIYFDACGLYHKAASMHKQTWDRKKCVLGEEHPSTLNSMANLASTYRNQGRWKEAEELGVQVVAKLKRTLGEENPVTLTSIANLASTYWNQGRWKEAEELGVQVVATRKRVLGEEHPNTLTSIANLASTYCNQGRWKEAEKLEVQVVAKLKRTLGEEHPDTLTSIANLASTYWNQERWKEAEKLEVQVVAKLKRTLGEEHPVTLTSYANLASTYCNQGRWKEAEELGVQVVATRKRVLGEEHPNTLSSMGNLAYTLKAQSQNAEAINLMEEKRYKDAEALYQRAYAGYRSPLGMDYPTTRSDAAHNAPTSASRKVYETTASQLGSSSTEPFSTHNIFHQSRNGSGEDGKIPALHLCGDPNSSGPSLTYELDGPLFAPEVYSKGSLGWARELLAECDQEHERCNKARRRNAREKFIPTRLIDVNFTRDMVRARLAGRPGLVRGNRSWLRELAPTASEIQGSDMVLGFGRWQAGILEQGENQISQGLDGLPSKSIAMPQGLAFRLGMHWWTKKIKATAWSVAPESAVRAS